MAELRAVVSLYQDMSKEWAKGAGRDLDKVIFSFLFTLFFFFIKWCIHQFQLIFCLILIKCFVVSTLHYEELYIIVGENCQTMLLWE